MAEGTFLYPSKSSTESDVPVGKSPAAVANMCLVSACNKFDAMAGMIGILELTAGPRKFAFFKHYLREGGLQFQAVEVSTLDDVAFMNENPPEPIVDRVYIRSGYFSRKANAELELRCIHRYRVLVQLGIALCALGKQVVHGQEGRTTMIRWKAYFCEALGIETDIPVEHLPQVDVLDSLYTYFAAHKDLRSILFSKILKYAKRNEKEHALVITCSVLARILKFSELEHLCLMSEFIYRRFYPTRRMLLSHMSNSSHLNVTKAVVRCLTSLMKYQQDHGMYWYSRLLEPDSVETVFDATLIHLVNFANSNARSYNGNPDPCTAQMLRTIDRLGLPVTFNMILKEARKNFEKIAYLYETVEDSVYQMDALRIGEYRVNKEALSTLVFGYSTCMLSTVD